MSEEKVLKIPTLTATTASDIALELRQAIYDGDFIDGQRLPPERQLSTHYNVSRTTVRQAIQQVEEMGLLTRKVGSGSFISYQPEKADIDIAHHTSPLELIEARIAFEPAIAKLAILHATPADVEEIHRHMVACMAADGDQEIFASADTKFHLAIAKATKNPLVIKVYEEVSQFREHKLWKDMRWKILSPERITDYNKEHQLIFECLKIRDVEQVADLVTQHLRSARGDLLGFA